MTVSLIGSCATTPEAKQTNFDNLQPTQLNNCPPSSINYGRTGGKSGTGSGSTTVAPTPQPIPQPNNCPPSSNNDHRTSGNSGSDSTTTRSGSGSTIIAPSNLGRPSSRSRTTRFGTGTTTSAPSKLGSPSKSGGSSTSVGRSGFGSFGRGGSGVG